jgi:hypothetical protein
MAEGLRQKAASILIISATPAGRSEGSCFQKIDWMLGKVIFMTHGDPIKVRIDDLIGSQQIHSRYDRRDLRNDCFKLKVISARPVREIRSPGGNGK